MKVTDRIAEIVSRIQAAFKAKDQASLDGATAELTTIGASVRDDEGALHLHLGGAGAEGGNQQYDDLSNRVGALEGGMGGIMDALEDLKKNGMGGAPKAGGEDSLGGGEGNDTVKGGDALEQEELEGMQDEAPEEKKEDVKAAKDSAFLGSAFQNMLALAEVLVPGIKAPTYDSAAKPKTTFDAICKLRRTALDLAYATPEGRAVIDSVHGKELKLAGMKCRDVRTLFNASAALRKAGNNAALHSTAAAKDGAPGPITSIAQLNEANRKRYAKQSA